MLFSALDGAQDPNLAGRLGYPADAKLLIIHADDLGVAHSENLATFEALNRGAVSSASIMVPCPWLTEAADYARAHPDADLGVHLTLTSEWKTYRWGPVSPRDQVPSLLDPDGYFYRTAADVARHARVADVERELRAQVETALKMGIHPTHLDSHMGALFTTPALIAALVKVARAYHLPFLVGRFPRRPAGDLRIRRTHRRICRPGVCPRSAPGDGGLAEPLHSHRGDPPAGRLGIHCSRRLRRRRNASRYGGSHGFWQRLAGTRLAHRDQ